jgi:hypothetical protein
MEMRDKSTNKLALAGIFHPFSWIFTSVLSHTSLLFLFSGSCRAYQMLFVVKFLITTVGWQPLFAVSGTSAFQTLGKRGGGMNRSSQCAVTRHLGRDSPRVLLAILSPTWTWDANFQRAPRQTGWHQTLQLQGFLAFTKAWHHEQSKARSIVRRHPRAGQRRPGM